MITITIETTNDAFGDFELDRAIELSCILWQLSEKINLCGSIEPQKIIDTNGNVVGGLIVEDLLENKGEQNV